MSSLCSSLEQCMLPRAHRSSGWRLVHHLLSIGVVVLTRQLLLHLRHLHQLPLRHQPGQLPDHRHVFGHGSGHLLELGVVIDESLKRRSQRVIKEKEKKEKQFSLDRTFMSAMDSSFSCPLGFFFWKSSIRFLMFVPISPKFRYKF